MIDAAACTPVPVSVMTCGLVMSESVIVSVPVRTPVVVGANLTLMRQLRPGARLPPQLLLSEKFALHWMLLIVSVVVPTFARVTCCAALIVPTIWLPNKSEVVLRLTPLIFCVTAADALPLTLPSPEYVAVRVRVPPTWNVIVQAPAVAAAEQLSPVLACTTTVPVTADPGNCGVTVYLMVTICPMIEGFGKLETIAVVLLALATVTVPAM